LLLLPTLNIVSKTEEEAVSFSFASLFLRPSSSAEPMRRSGGIGSTEAEAEKRFGFAEKRRHWHRLRRSQSRTEEASEAAEKRRSIKMNKKQQTIIYFK
jgi:hypothetical protein